MEFVTKTQLIKHIENTTERTAILTEGSIINSYLFLSAITTLFAHVSSKLDRIIKVYN